MKIKLKKCKKEKMKNKEKKKRGNKEGIEREMKWEALQKNKKNAKRTNQIDRTQKSAQKN